MVNRISSLKRRNVTVAAIWFPAPQILLILLYMCIVFVGIYIIKYDAYAYVYTYLIITSYWTDHNWYNYGAGVDGNAY